MNSEFIKIPIKFPMFNLQNQNYKSIFKIIFYEKDFYRTESKSIELPKRLFNNIIFKDTKYDFYKKLLNIDIVGKNPRVLLQLNQKVTKNNFKNISLRMVGVKYSGMKHFSSYLGNTVGIPILKDSKIIKPDIQLEKEMFEYFTPNGKNPYNLKIKNLFEFMMKYPTHVYYSGNLNSKTFLKYFDISDHISNDFYKDDFEDIIKKFSRQKDSEYIIMDDYFISTKELNKFLPEVMNIVLGRDIKQFKEHQQISRSISKTTSLSNLETLTKGLRATLFEHQKIGISWLWNLYDKKLPGAILADDVGLGKTLQSIGLMTILKNKNLLSTKDYKDVVVVCPASVISVWEKEIINFNNSLLKHTKIYSFEKFQNVTLTNKPVLLIIDEAQRAKNKNTLNNKRLSTVNSKFTLLLSGTPIENRTQDLYNILFLVDPIFSKIYNVLYRMSKNEHTIATETKKIIDGIYLRRLKTKNELAAKLNIIDVYIPMNRIETELHKAIKNFYGNKLIKAKATNNFQYYNEAIVALGRLRQCVSWAKQLEEFKYIKKSIPNISSKSSKLLSLIKKNPDEKFVIFSEYSKTIKFLKSILPGKTLVIDGSVPSAKRGEIIKTFQEDPDYKYIIVASKAGNSGITLHSANNIVLYDLWWNPARIHQMIARVYRIGQTRDVNAYMFINEKSIDENIMKVIDVKKEIISTFENTSTNDDTDTLKKLINNIF